MLAWSDVWWLLLVAVVHELLQSSWVLLVSRCAVRGLYFTLWKTRSQPLADKAALSSGQPDNHSSKLCRWPRWPALTTAKKIACWLLLCWAVVHGSCRAVSTSRSWSCTLGKHHHNARGATQVATQTQSLPGRCCLRTRPIENRAALANMAAQQARDSRSRCSCFAACVQAAFALILVTAISATVIENNPPINQYTELSVTLPTPTARTSSAAVNLIDWRTLVFGGLGHSTSGFFVLSDTWEFEMSTVSWYRVQYPAEVGAPPARYGHTLTNVLFDSVQRLLRPQPYLFGGFTFDQVVEPLGLTAANLRPLNDLWQFHSLAPAHSPRSWSKVVLADGSPKPPGRADHSAALVNGRCIVVFGGQTVVDGKLTVLDDLWAYHAGSRRWYNVHVGTERPEGRQGHIGVGLEGGRNNTMIVSGGCTSPVLSTSLSSACTSTDEYSTGVWELELQPDCQSGTWTKVLDFSPFQSIYAASTLDSKSGNIVVTGGLQASGPAGNVWSYHSEAKTWQTFSPTILSAVPPPRWHHSCVILATDPPVVGTMFGQDALMAYNDDVWSFSTLSYTWAKIVPVDSPMAQALGASAVLGTTVYYYGGLSLTASTAEDDKLWKYNLAEEVLAFETVESLTKLWGHSMFAIGNQLVFFGGASGVPPEVELSSQVTAHVPGSLYSNTVSPSTTAAPAPRFGQFGDPMPGPERAFVIFGGSTAVQSAHVLDATFETFANDTWIFTFTDASSGTWEPVTSEPHPCARSWGTSAVLTEGVENPNFVIFGGIGVACIGRTGTPVAGSQGAVLGDDVWALDLVTRKWRFVQISQQGPPPLFASAGTSLSPSKFIVAGGFVGIGQILSSATVYIGSFQPDGTFSWYGSDMSQADSRGAATMSVVPGTEVLTVILGGVREDGVQGLKFVSQERLVAVGCNPGSFSPNFDSVDCALCPVGTYSMVAGATMCTSCPGDSTSLLVGASSKQLCTVCQPGICNGHGSCDVSPETFRGSCTCNPGYTGENCETNALGIALGTVFAGLLIAALGALYYRRSKRSLRMLMEETTLTKQLLDSNQLELAELERSWQIRQDEIDYKRHVGSGGFGEVWLAEYMDRPVAVKRLKESVQLWDDLAVEEFQAECKLMRSLRHRNIVFFYGAGLTDGVPFLVIEWLPLGNLTTILESDLELSSARKLGFVHDVASGMAFLHASNKIHRDLKTDNLLVSDTWVTKIADFGTARICGVLKQRTASMRGKAMKWDIGPLTTGVGTLCWTAPEVLSDGASVSHYNVAADVYSFAIIMWQVAMRLLPFTQFDTVHAIREAVQHGGRPEPLPDEHSNQAPAVGYVDLMCACWDQDQLSRPTAQEIVDAVSSLTPAGSS
eukprot:m.125262 g.125262  ORF g.125262 m.125262 type:complete len:1355 (-) comp16649_c0_seq1:659-4723(-)